MSAIDEDLTSSPLSAPHPIRIDEILDHILKSPSFSSSRQGQQLLRYLVDQSRQTRDEGLKERTIGIEVFGRKPDYNTGDDPIVRSRVGELRKRLAQYYQSQEAADVAVRLSIPQGSYRVLYQVVDHPKSGAGASILEPHPLEQSAVRQPESEISDVPFTTHLQDSSPRKQPWRLFLWFAVASVVVAIITFLVVRPSHKTTALDQFWEPELRNSKQILIYVGTNSVYVPSVSAKAAELQGHHVPLLPPFTTPVTLTPENADASNYEFTTSGDLLATVQLTSLLAERHVQFEVRMGENISVGDLRHSPTILVGGSNNVWTMEISKDLPIAYIIGVGLQDRTGTQAILQDRTGNHTIWKDNVSAGQAHGESYGIAARLLEPKTGNTLILVAGLSSLGTRTAGQFIADPNALARLAATAPKGWERKNIEVVLRTDVLERDTSAPSVVTARYW